VTFLKLYEEIEMVEHSKDLEFKPMKLKYCVNCGQKQHSPIQKFCSHCGTAYGDPDFHIEPVQDSREIPKDKSIARGLGGWLIIPYLGFYSAALLGMLILLKGNNSTLPQTLEHIFAGLGLVIFGILAIVQVHKKSRSLLSTVVVLYSLSFLESVYLAYINNSPWTVLGAVVGSALWITYFFKSRRVKQMLGIKHSGDIVRNEPWKKVLAIIVIGTFALSAIVLIVLALAASGAQTQANSALVTQYNSLEAEFTSLPSTTTKNKADWDSYYTSYVQQFQTLNASLLGASNTKTNKDLQTAVTDNIALITLDESSSDMNFEITTDNVAITSDTNNVQQYTAQDNTSCALSQSNPYITCDRSMENNAKSQLASDTARLASDKAAYASQQSQITTLNTKVSDDNTAIAIDSK
jgi:hypothetical protein